MAEWTERDLDAAAAAIAGAYANLAPISRGIAGVALDAVADVLVRRAATNGAVRVLLQAANEAAGRMVKVLTFEELQKRAEELQYGERPALSVADDLGPCCRCGRSDPAAPCVPETT